MTQKDDGREAILGGLNVIDGLATELEYRGARIDVYHTARAWPIVPRSSIHFLSP
jgi:hypothetical protein